MKTLLALLFALAHLTVHAQPLKLAQPTISEFTNAIKLAYKYGVPNFKDHMTKWLKRDFPNVTLQKSLENMGRDTKTLNSAIHAVYAYNGNESKMASFLTTFKVSPPAVAELTAYALYADARDEKVADTIIIASQQEEQQPGEEVYTVVEQPPLFIGGDDSLSRYLTKNISYPEEAYEKGISGTVFIIFVITGEGNIVDVRSVEKPKGGGLEEEAVRVIAAMPKWKGARQSGKPVSVQMTFPIKFTLPDPDK